MLGNSKNLLRQVAKVTSSFDTDVYLVGGAVRDLILGQEVNDLDLLLSDSLVEIVEKVASEFTAEHKVHLEYRTGGVALSLASDGIKRIDFSSFRSEIYSSPAALPQISSGTLETDLARRDFTVNALAMQLDSIIALESQGALDLEAFTGLVIDQNKGLRDLESGTIEVLHDKSFIDDPTRLFRAARYKTLLAGSYGSQTAKLFRQAVTSDLIDKLEGYRIKSELQRICVSRSSAACFRELYSLGVMQSLGFLELSEDVFTNLSAIDSNVEGAFVQSMKVICRDLSTLTRDSILKRLDIRGQVKQAILSDISIDGAT